MPLLSSGEPSLKENIASQALEKCECDDAPVPVEEIANSLGLEVVEFAFHQKISGLLKKEQGIIGVNQGQHPVRRRFTIAHELGHFLLGHGIETAQEEIVDETFGEDFPQEREANMFASFLLMPGEWVKKEVKAEGKIDLDKLSAKFGVSKQAMTIRLLALKLI